MPRVSGAVVYIVGQLAGTNRNGRKSRRLQALDLRKGNQDG